MLELRAAALQGSPGGKSALRNPHGSQLRACPMGEQDFWESLVDWEEKKGTVSENLPCAHSRYHPHVISLC